jgi:methionyl aminopeptidase
MPVHTRFSGNAGQAGCHDRDIEEECERLLREHEVVSAFKGYRGYPAALCVSVNDEVVHGIPTRRALKEGDIVSLDVGVIYREHYGDCAASWGAGRLRAEDVRLIEVAQKALARAIEQAVAGNRVGDISSAIQATVEAQGFSVVREFAGHGIGRRLHENPEVPNFGAPGKGELLHENMTLAIEPMINAGRPWVKILPDGWTAVTSDGSRSAHCEETVLITKGPADILTKC